jgi:tetratricopeptide (TPR) repeat protein
MNKKRHTSSANHAPPGAAPEVSLVMLAGAGGGSSATPPGLTIPPRPGAASIASKKHANQKRLVIVGLSSIQNEIIAHLSRQAEIAYALRQLDRVEALSRQLEPLHAPVAAYFRGLAAQQSGRGDLDRAQELLELAAEHAPRPIQARALLILGSVAEYRGDYKAELEFYRQALELNRDDLYTAVETRRAIAIRASIEGDRAGAIQILESVRPLAALHPYLSAQLLNHLAVEYHQEGRLDEARQLSEIVCTSPLASIYEEFHETRKEIIEDQARTENRASAVTVRNSDVVEADARPQSKQIFHRQKERARRRIARNRFCRIIASKGRPAARDLIARKSEPTRSQIIDQIMTAAPIHAPPAISIA